MSNQISQEKSPAIGAALLLSVPAVLMAVMMIAGFWHALAAGGFVRLSALFGLGLAVPVGIWLIAALRRVLKPQRVRPEGLLPATWTLGEQAMLTGGPRRVVEAWLAALVAQEHVRMETPEPGRRPVFQRIHVLQPPKQGELQPVWEAMLPFQGYDQASLEKLWAERTQQICVRLEQRGALPSMAPRRWFQRNGLLALAGTGLASIALGTLGGVAEAWTLGGGLMVGTFLAAAFARPSARFTRDTVSVQLAQEVFEHHALARRAPQAKDVGWAVAAGGLAVLVGTPYEALAYQPLMAQQAQDSGGDTGVLFLGAMGDGTPSSVAAPASDGFSAGGGFGGDGSSTGGDGGSSGYGSSGCGGGGCGGA